MLKHTKKEKWMLRLRPRTTVLLFFFFLFYFKLPLIYSIHEKRQKNLVESLVLELHRSVFLFLFCLFSFFMYAFCDLINYFLQ